MLGSSLRKPSEVSEIISVTEEYTALSGLCQSLTPEPPRSSDGRVLGSRWTGPSRRDHFPQAVCVHVCMWVCVCDSRHTDQGGLTISVLIPALLLTSYVALTQ